MEGAPIKLENISRGEFQNVIGLLTDTMRGFDSKIQCIANDAKEMHDSFDKMQRELIPLLQDYQKREKDSDVGSGRVWDVKLVVIGVGGSVGASLITAALFIALKIGGSG